ncbi:MAG TPA: hypothetical protein VN648_21910 [Candidatus Methylomirabilis sp.]|nr:hypothetical protein [Candidatus Methylomirabilis sp.]
MSMETPELQSLAYRLDAILERLHNLEVQVSGLVTSQTVEARAFVVMDERGEVCARLEMQEYAPCLTFYDRAGTARLKIGLRTDSSPLLQVEGREILLGRG